MVYVAQEGGDHYQAEYQHWDWVIDVGLSYLEGCATKYVSRWWKKNGLQDLLKAETYVKKMIANYDAVYALSTEPPENIDELNTRFRIANSLPDLEYQFCCLMSDWQSTQQLEFALRLLEDLIQAATLALATTLAGQGGNGASGARCGAAGGIAGQGAATNKATDVPSSGHPAPFGYDDWHENGFHAIKTTKTDEGYNG